MKEDGKDQVKGIVYLLMPVGFVMYSCYALFIANDFGMMDGFKVVLFMLVLYVAVADVVRIFSDRAIKDKQDEIELSINSMRNHLSSLINEKNKN